MNTPAFQNKWFVLLCLFTTPLMLIQATCQPKPPTKKTFNPEPIKELALYDRHSAEPYCETHGRDIDRVLVEQYDSIEISSISTTAYVFSWGGEMGGPWTRVLCFCRNSPPQFQKQFVYEGEYKMSRMRGADNQIQSGENHTLGTQLSQLANDMGPSVYLNRDSVRDLLTSTMEGLLGCARFRPEADSTIRNWAYNKYLTEQFEKWRVIMAANTDPYVIYFFGELTLGFWKGTVRQFDHTGRFCIELEYLNGENAYTFWL
jgi:hypothetical protein